MLVLLRTRLRRARLDRAAAAYAWMGESGRAVDRAARWRARAPIAARRGALAVRRRGTVPLTLAPTTA